MLPEPEPTTGKAKATRLTFTVNRLKDYPSPATGRTWIYDETCPGLTLCITANGSRTYYLYRKIEGRPHRLKLGRFTDITLEDARRLANKQKGRIADGQNPAADKQTARNDATFGEAFRIFIDRHKKPHRKTWKDDENRYDTHLTAWASRRARTITSDDVITVRNRVANSASNATANRVLSLISVVFNTVIKDPPYNPCRGVDRLPEIPRQRYLTRDEVAKLMKAIDAEQPIAADFFRLCLFTGQRRGNVLAMKWSDINLEAETWRIAGEETKNGQPISVPLLPHAVEVLKRRHIQSVTKRGFVFPTWSAAGHLSQPNAAWLRITTAAGLIDEQGKPTVRIHDLRRTHASWLAMSGAPAQVVQRAMNHKSISTTMNVYAMVNSETVRAAGTAGMDMMMAAKEEKPAEGEDEVVAEPKRKRTK